jgi:hypothetical protein
MLTFGIGLCFHFQSSPLPSLCNRFGVSVTAGCTAGTDILESCVGWLVIVREFQRQSGSDTPLPAISFLETRRNHKGPNQMTKEGGEEPG